jgi:hypothetical protein
VLSLPRQRPRQHLFFPVALRSPLTHASPSPLHSPENNHIASVLSHSNTRPAPPDRQRPLVYDRVQRARLAHFGLAWPARWLGWRRIRR